MAKESFKSKAEELAWKKLCEDIISTAQEITDSGHIVVFTSPKDKEPLEFANTILREVTGSDHGPKPATTAGAKRFTAI